MAKSNQTWASSLAEAKRRAHVDITCPSGARYTIRALDLDELAADGGLPHDLLRVVLLEMVPGGVVSAINDKLVKGDAESLEQARKLSQDVVAVRDRIVLHAVVAPALKEKDVAALDPFDKDMIAKIAQRRLAVDAEGKGVGADPLATFRSADQK